MCLSPRTIMRLTSNKRLVRKICKAADHKGQITMSQIVNLLNAEGRKLKSEPQTYIHHTLRDSGYVNHIGYGLYRVTNKAKGSVAS